MREESVLMPDDGGGGKDGWEGKKACTDQRWARSGPQGWTALEEHLCGMVYGMAYVEIVFDARRTWEPGFEEYLWEGPISTCTHPYSNPTGGSHFSCPTSLDYLDSVAAALIREGHTHICSLNVDSCKQLFIIPPLLLFLTIHLLFQGVAHLNEWGWLIPVSDPIRYTSSIMYSSDSPIFVVLTCVVSHVWITSSRL